MTRAIVASPWLKPITGWAALTALLLGVWAVIDNEFYLRILIIVGIFAIALGILSLVTVNLEKIRRRSQGHRHAWVLLAGLVFMIVAGIATGTGQESLFL